MPSENLFLFNFSNIFPQNTSIIKNLKARPEKSAVPSPEAKLNEIEPAAWRKPRRGEKGSKIQAKPHKSSLSNRPIPKTTPFKLPFHNHPLPLPSP